jgi:beta-galactosidase
MSFRDEDGKGVMVTGMPHLSVSALPYATDDLDYGESQNRHTADLVKRAFIDLNIDLKQSGLGGDDSWGATPMEKYRLYPGKYTYSFRITPLASGDQEGENASILYEIDSF